MCMQYIPLENRTTVSFCSKKQSWKAKAHWEAAGFQLSLQGKHSTSTRLAESWLSPELFWSGPRILDQSWISADNSKMFWMTLDSRKGVSELQSLGQSWFATCSVNKVLLRYRQAHLCIHSPWLFMLQWQNGIVCKASLIYKKSYLLPGSVRIQNRCSVPPSIQTQPQSKQKPLDHPLLHQVLLCSCLRRVCSLRLYIWRLFQGVCVGRGEVESGCRLSRSREPSSIPLDPTLSLTKGHFPLVFSTAHTGLWLQRLRPSLLVEISTQNSKHMEAQLSLIYTNFPLNQQVYGIESVTFKWGRGLARSSEVRR